MRATTIVITRLAPLVTTDAKTFQNAAVKKRRMRGDRSILFRIVSMCRFIFIGAARPVSRRADIALNQL